MKKTKSNSSNSILETIEPSFLFADFLMMGFMAFKYYILWSNPQTGDAANIFQMAGLMGFEFVMIHSGVFMAIMPKWLSLLVFAPLYGLFAWAFNKIIGGDNLVAYIYMIAVFNRMRFAFFNVSEEMKQKQVGRSVFAAMFYFFLVFGVVLGTSLIPELGLSPENLEKIGYTEAKTHGGLFLDEPKTAICLGTIYYLGLCLFSLPGRWFWNEQKWEARTKKWTKSIEDYKKRG
ncbi:MAG: hypothetical protein KA796_04750 [Chryseobacterium sp.]|nr:hypothetical protein [Chryseobacterium sp.]MBP7499161.1 hypothetical protein [Chryseobacterium sp.]